MLFLFSIFCQVITQVERIKSIRSLICIGLFMFILLNNFVGFLPSLVSFRLNLFVLGNGWRSVAVNSSAQTQR